MANGITHNGHLAKIIGGLVQGVILLLLIFFGSNVIDNGKTLVKLSTMAEISAGYFKDHEERIRILEIMRYRSYSFNGDIDGDS